MGDLGVAPDNTSLSGKTGLGGPSFDVERKEQESAAEVKDAENKERKADAVKAKKAVKEVQGKVEKSTLGDLGVLAELKKKMEGGSKDESAS